MRPKTTRSRGRGCAFVALVLVAAFLLAGAYLYLYMDYTGPTLVQISGAEEPLSGPPYALTSEQHQLISVLGYPDSFTLLFYQEMDELGEPYDVRFETWHYSAAGREIAFVNGAMVSDEAMGLGEAVVPTPYRPEQFVASMRLRDVLASTGISEYARAAADPILVASGEVYFASQLTFGMKAGRLMTVETMALEAEG